MFRIRYLPRLFDIVLIPKAKCANLAPATCKRFANTCSKNASSRTRHFAGLCSSCHCPMPLPRSRYVSAGYTTAAANRDSDSITSGPKEFEISANKKNPAFDYKADKNFSKQYSVPSFKDLGLNDKILQGLENMQISQPTIIQIKCIPEVLKGKNVFCAAQTGSGKTLAYLAPILQRLKEEEERGLLARYRRPRVCIVAPFRELAVQILKVVKSMSHYVPIRSLGLIGGQKDQFIHKGLKDNPIDIIVGTPGTILDIHKRQKLFFTDLSCIVFDEADTMLDSSFRGMTNSFIKTLKNRATDSAMVRGELSYVFAAATLPNKEIINKLSDSVPKLSVIKAHIHKVLPHVRHRFIKTSQPEKPELLLRILKSEMQRNKKVMIFVNSSSTCNWLSKFLVENEVNHKKLSGKVLPEERHDVFEDYNSDRRGILVCTDLASRGLDTPDLFCVINYDCPLNPADYIHRAGRTGRARADYIGTPEVITFLSRNWELNLARSIKLAADKMTWIENIDIVQRDKSPIGIRR